MNDLISRQAAIDVMSIGKEFLTRVLDDMSIVENERKKYEWGLGLIESYINDIEDLPPAQLDRKKWKWTYNSFINAWRCDQCFQSSVEKGNYCPNCGAEMEGWKDEAD